MTDEKKPAPRTGPGSKPAAGRRGDRDARQLNAALNPGKPVFPFPADIPEDHKSIWCATVNVKPVDYWDASDVPLLKLYCRTAADIQRLSDEIEVEGEVISNAKGNPVVNPKIVIRGFAEARFMSVCTKLRMQPSSRTDNRTEKKNEVRKQNAKKTAQAIEDEDTEGLLAGAGPDGVSPLIN